MSTSNPDVLEMSELNTALAAAYDKACKYVEWYAPGSFYYVAYAALKELIEFLKTESEEAVFVTGLEDD